MPLNIDSLQFSFDDDPLEELPASVRADIKYTALALFAAVITIEALVIFVLLCVLPGGRPQRPNPSQPVKTLIVLGSGGHTAEMLRLVSSLDRALYCPRIYITAETDALSGRKAVEAEKGFQPDGKARDFDLYAIPRSREVGQSYITSVFTTLRSLAVATVAVWRIKPDVVLANGPGTCIPICMAAWLFRKLYLKHCEVVYVESIARVKSLSLSGRILYKLRVADVFLVQWPELQAQYPRARFIDRLY